MGKMKLWLKKSAKVIYIEALKLFILQKYGCNKGLILLEHSTFKGIAFIIAMRSRKFNKYSISIYRKAASSPGHVAFLILHDNKKSPHNPILDDL